MIIKFSINSFTNIYSLKPNSYVFINKNQNIIKSINNEDVTYKIV